MYNERDSRGSNIYATDGGKLLTKYPRPVHVCINLYCTAVNYIRGRQAICLGVRKSKTIHKRGPEKSDMCQILIILR